ncbi:MAG TPA: GDP-mannose 4,6-dehydratase [Pirellulaceae bacterium]|nr:GDP-mannose 4,6-dehydratase [Pirellulaceae bacterium]
MEQECVLVTGGAGFIGTHLVPRLLRDRHRSLVVVDRLSYASRFDRIAPLLSRPRIAFVQGDVRDAALGARLFRDFPISAVIHLAAESHVDRSIADPDPFVGSNVVGTHRLAEAARAAWQGRDRERHGSRPRWIQVSTDEVYGSLESPKRAAVGDALRPSSPYSASKGAADLLLGAAATTWGFPLIIARTCNNYGPGQHPEKFIPRMVAAAACGEPLPIYGDGRQVREWIHVADHCEGLVAVLERGAIGATYHLGSEERHENRIVAQRIAARVARVRSLDRPDDPLAPVPLTSVPDRLGHDRRYALDSSESRRALGWEPSVPFEAGLDETIDLLLAEQDRRLAVPRSETLRSGGGNSEQAGFGPSGS